MISEKSNSTGTCTTRTYKYQYNTTCLTQERLLQANKNDYARLFQNFDYTRNKKKDIQENENKHNWIPFVDCYQAEIVQTITTIITLSSPISIYEWTECHTPFHWKNFFLQRWRCWSFVQKIQFKRIGSCFFRLQWITSLLLKLTMTIWNIWQFWNDIFLPSTTQLAAVAQRSMKKIFFSNKLLVIFSLFHAKQVSFLVF